MTLRFPIALAVMSTIAVVAPASGAPTCDARSGAATAALVELYTSEGCSSCPPADQRLRQIRAAVAPDAVVVPLALHVDYWDSIGWKDPFAKPAFSARQSWLVRLNQRGVVYTPHFFVGGAELGSWQGRLGDAVGRQNARPARADIHLTSQCHDG